MMRRQADCEEIKVAARRVCKTLLGDACTSVSVGGDHNSHDVNAVIFLMTDGLGVVVQQPERGFALQGDLMTQICQQVLQILSFQRRKEFQCSTSARMGHPRG